MRLAARNRVLKQLLRHGRIFREGKTAWTKLHRAWLARQRLDDPLAQEALEQLLIHVAGIERQLDTLDARLAEIAGSERWGAQVQILTRFRGIATITALGLIAEIGDFARFSHPRELAAWLGITPSEYSSGDQQHRGHITLAGNRHARRLLIEAAWHYRHAPRLPASGPPPDERAWHAQVRLHHRHRHLTDHGKRSTVANVAVARELTGFLWAAMTNQPLRITDTAASSPSTATSSRRPPPSNSPPRGGAGRRGATARRILAVVYAISTRDASTRQLTTGHCPAVPTPASQSDSRRCARTRRPAPPTTILTPTPTTKTAQSQRPLDTRVHLRQVVAAVGHDATGAMHESLPLPESRRYPRRSSAVTNAQNSRDGSDLHAKLLLSDGSSHAGRVRGGACGPLLLTNPVVYNGRFQTYPPPPRPTGR